MDPYIQRRLRHYKAVGVKRVRAQGSGRCDECDCCKALNGLDYDIDAVPEFPPRGCTCPVGCGCRVTHVIDDSVLKVTLRDSDPKQPESVEVAAGSSTHAQPAAPDLHGLAQEGWARFLSGSRLMLGGAGQLLRVLAIGTTRLLARGAAHCIHFISTTFPALTKHTCTQAKVMLRRRGNSLTTWASATLTAQPPLPIRNEAVKVKVEG